LKSNKGGEHVVTGGGEVVSGGEGVGVYSDKESVKRERVCQLRRKEKTGRAVCAKVKNRGVVHIGHAALC